MRLDDLPTYLPTSVVPVASLAEGSGGHWTPLLFLLLSSDGASLLEEGLGALEDVTYDILQGDEDSTALFLHHYYYDYYYHYYHDYY